MIETIGAHSSAMGGSSVDGSHLSDGHAWLSLHYMNGRSTSIGLWACSDVLELRHFIRDPIGLFDSSGEKYEVLFGEEDRRHYRAIASRYYGLDASQRNGAVMALGLNSGWRIGHNCASWVAEKIRGIFGVPLAASEGFGIADTPRALGSDIRRLESKDPTSIKNPKYFGAGSFDGPSSTGKRNA